MRLIWLTDIHLDHLKDDDAQSFCQRVNDSGPDNLLLTGDISNGEKIEKHLKMIKKQISCPVYFVLGNHDFYKSSISEVNKLVEKITSKSKQLIWMDKSRAVKLSDTTALVGHSGFNDGRNGDYENSEYEPADFYEIEEFKDISEEERLELMKKLADESADHIRKVLPEACKTAPEVIMLTHVPPYSEACWFESEVTDKNHQPFFSSKAMGEAIHEVMADFPKTGLTVYCGHTHHSGEARIADNIKVYTGAATYGFPVAQRTFYIS